MIVCDWTFCMMRFAVKKVTKGWMVWDTAAKTVAGVDRYQAVGLSAETANRFSAMLNKREMQELNSGSASSRR